MGSPLIALRDVEKRYRIGERELPILRGVTLEIAAGEAVAVMGPSGSGKSTLLNILGFLDTPTSGSYRFDGDEVSQKSQAELVQLRRFTIGFIFQTYNLLPRMDAVHNVEVPLLYQGVSSRERRERSLAALNTVGLRDRASHRSNELSGGEQQRVAIARTIAVRPRVIVADEPTGNLDSQTGTEIMQLLIEQHRAGATLIIVTHDQRIASQAQRTITLYDGRIQGADA